MYKTLLVVFFFLCSTAVLAQQIISCPNIIDIQSGKFSAWLPLYVDNEELASQADIRNFINKVTNFSYAAWDRDYLESAHCFYNLSVRDSRIIVLAHDAYRPAEHPIWQWLTLHKHAECRTEDASRCAFQL